MKLENIVTSYEEGNLRSGDIMIVVLRYKGKLYECIGYGWWDNDWKEYISPNGWDGVRTCEHDYAALLPDEVRNDHEWGCEQKYIELVDYYVNPVLIKWDKS